MEVEKGARGGKTWIMTNIEISARGYTNMLFWNMKEILDQHKSSCSRVYSPKSWGKPMALGYFSDFRLSPQFSREPWVFPSSISLFQLFPSLSGSLVHWLSVKTRENWEYLLTPLHSQFGVSVRCLKFHLLTYMASGGRQAVESMPQISGFPLIATVSKVKMPLAQASFLVWMLLRNLILVFVFCIHFL